MELVGQEEGMWNTFNGLRKQRCSWLPLALGATGIWRYAQSGHGLETQRGGFEDKLLVLSGRTRTRKSSEMVRKPRHSSLVREIARSCLDVNSQKIMEFPLGRVSQKMAHRYGYSTEQN
jgi:hypothetical protein